MLPVGRCDRIAPCTDSEGDAQVIGAHNSFIRCTRDLDTKKGEYLLDLAKRKDRERTIYKHLIG